MTECIASQRSTTVVEVEIPDADEPAYVDRYWAVYNERTECWHINDPGGCSRMVIHRLDLDGVILLLQHAKGIDRD